MKVCLLALVRLPRVPHVVPVNHLSMSPIADSDGLPLWKTQTAGGMARHHRNAVDQWFFLCRPVTRYLR